MKKTILIFCSIILSFAYINLTPKSVSADSYSEIVIESNSNRVLYESNAHTNRYPASTTKILTAICIIENCNLDEVITIKKQTTGIEGSSIYLEEGEKLSIKDLLYGLMLRSGNDCAVTLATYCSGSIDNFAKLMNSFAKKIGAINSNFVNPHGLHDDNHYTTAYDLAIISSYAIKNPTFKEIVSTKKTTIPFTTRNYNRVLINKNKMLSEYEGSTGIKTGFTKKAGRCLVSSSYKNDMELISVVLNCPPMWEESKKLLNYGYNEYKNTKLIECDNIIAFTNSTLTNSKIGLYAKNDVILPLKNEELKDIQVEVNYPKTLDFAFEKDTPIGEIKILYKNNLLFTEKLFTIIGVNWGLIWE